MIGIHFDEATDQSTFANSRWSNDCHQWRWSLLHPCRTSIIQWNVFFLLCTVQVALYIALCSDNVRHGEGTWIVTIFEVARLGVSLFLLLLATATARFGGFVAAIYLLVGVGAGGSWCHGAAENYLHWR